VTRQHQSTVDHHAGLHSESGANRAEHRGRAVNPIIKIADLAWLDFEKPNLDQAETFARAFGFEIVQRNSATLILRGSMPGSPCLVIRKGRRSRFAGMTFRAAELADLHTLARKTDLRVDSIRDPVDGFVVRMQDPSGFPVSVVHHPDELSSLPEKPPHSMNFGCEPVRINSTQRSPNEPAQVQRLGHVVLATPHILRALNWYIDTFGMIVSDFQYIPAQRDRGPTLAFIRCDRGTVPTDHHTVALHLGPVAEYTHSAYQVTDLDAVATGGEYLLRRGYEREWGIGRHILGSQIFDYWRDPDHFMVEHFTDGDLFDNTVEPGWAPMTASGLYQWGPPITRKFLGANLSPKLVRDVIAGLREPNELTLSRLVAMAKGLNS
jgi:catechol 2,3-dioxygenase-like lactoylglutathione lyase family enzyme